LHDPPEISARIAAALGEALDRIQRPEPTPVRMNHQQRGLFG